jgi:hypothetical protein
MTYLFYLKNPLLTWTRKTILRKNMSIVKPCLVWIPLIHSHPPIYLKKRSCHSGNHFMKKFLGDRLLILLIIPFIIILCPNIFNGLTLQETTQHPTQIDSMGLNPFEILDGGNVHMEDREDKASSCELINSMPYQTFLWDNGNAIVDVYQVVSSYFSSSFFINNESSCSSIYLTDIIDTSGSHHCL